MNAQQEKTIALFHWGDLIEDFLDSIGISFESFCQEMTGGWMFGYIEALRLAGIRTVLFCISARVDAPTYFTHAPTGAKICVLPSSKLYQASRSHISNPYAWDLKEALGNVGGARRQLLAALKDILPYLATPLRMLARELRREGCQAILCQEYEYARFDVCVLLGQLMRLPVYATFQGGNWQMSRLERWLRPLTIKACAGLIVATQTEAKRVQEHYGVSASKLARIFNPLDLSTWQIVDRQQARATLDIPNDAQVVVYHGRIDMHRKGLDVLTDAWSQVCRDRPHDSLRLLLVGTGSDADQLRDRISALQLPGVLWIDEYVLDRTAMRNYLCAANIYTLPSRHEGFPVAPLEAMACGLPVVATDAPGVPDIFETGEASGGLVVPRENPVALAHALERLLDDEVLQNELGERARRRVEACFSLKAVGEQLRALLGWS